MIWAGVDTPHRRTVWFAASVVVAIASVLIFVATRTERR
jgi:hypothetical protein